MSDQRVAVPGYWMHETSGVLRPAVEAYLQGKALSPPQIATLRAYFRQWIMSPVWDQNPHGNPGLAQLRAGIDGLTSRAAISLWLHKAVEEGIDPL
jgi:hypothetical protein